MQLGLKASRSVDRATLGKSPSEDGIANSKTLADSVSTKSLTKVGVATRESQRNMSSEQQPATGAGSSQKKSAREEQSNQQAAKEFEN